jgi:platelet-activating factor acetylhydrolase
MAIFPNLGLFPCLPSYPGQYQVGSIDLEIPLESPKHFQVLETTVETILVRFFYPLEENVIGKKKCTPPSWLPQPSMEYAKGYARFLKQPILPTSFVISFATYNTTIPAVQNAPPFSSSKTPLPVMIFSHGLGGSRNAYSQWCGSLASYGIFVAAIEHRDGSAPISIVHAGTEEQYSIPYRRITEYNDNTKHYRTSQIAQRTFEVSNLVALLRDINSGKSVNVTDEKQALLDQFKGILNTQKGQFIMAGHSFGAATTVAACKDKETTIEADYPLKDEFKAAIMLDIWMLVIPTS